MKCFYHYDKDFIKICNECHHPLCEDCLINLKGVSYCQECLEKMIQPQAPQEVRTKRSLKKPMKSAILATWLSIFPGLGLIYLELYLKGIALFIIFLGLSAYIQQIPLKTMIILGFWLFQLIYTNQEAKRINRIWIKIKEGEAKKEKDPIIWGTLLIFMGLLFLIGNFGYDLLWLYKLWPLFLVAIGMNLIWSFFKNSQSSSGEP